MKKYLLLLLPALCAASEIPPTPYPVFLRAGYSSILEFDTTPTRVVLGDSQSFQVERLERSIVIKTLVPYASSNLFVYFKATATRLFVLTASEDALPTYYRKFEAPTPPKAPSPGVSMRTHFTRGARLRSARFDREKDYLTIEAEVSADSIAVVRPNWPLVRLRDGTRTLAPLQLWSERKDVQKDSKVRCRFIFAKPNVRRALTGTVLVIPLEGDSRTLTLSLKGGTR
jgi:hypothetical protein